MTTRNTLPAIPSNSTFTILRSTLFLLVMIPVTIVCAAACIAGMLISYPFRVWVCTFWCGTCLFMLEHLCGLGGRIVGRENLPSHAVIVMSKHQSAWETIMLQYLVPVQSWVVKRELLWFPFFGWGLWTLRPIALDRSKGVEASKQLLEKGVARLKAGSSIMLFPEGTRVAAGTRGKYKHGGSRLACTAGVDVIPVAVNSGEFWPRNGFLKLPGTITLSIGPAISTAGKSPAEVTAEVENWIETEMSKISGVGPYWRGVQAADSQLPAATE